MMALLDVEALAVILTGAGSRPVGGRLHSAPDRDRLLYAPSHEHNLSFTDEMARRGPIPQDLRAVSRPEEAAYEADVTCAATTSKTPLFSDSDLKSGVHIWGVGSYSLEMQEIPAETIARAPMVVDSHEMTLAESGD